MESFEEIAARHAERDDDGKYPGSRHTRRSVSERTDLGDDVDPESVEAMLAEEEPRVLEVRGEARDFYTIGALARCLNREVQTLRKWERQGYLPKATYRSDGKKQDRLYTFHQIKGLVLLAREEGLMQPEKKKRIDQTDFPRRAASLFHMLMGGTR